MPRHPVPPTRAVERLRLRDGREVDIRPIAPSDLGELRRAISRADPETLRMRFLGGRPPSTDEELRYLVEVDHVDREAIVAVTNDGVGVAIARYDRQPGTNRADVAVAVDPGWRGVRLASELLRRLADRALANGITEFTADYYAGNDDVADLVRRFGRRISHELDFGVVEDAIQLPRP